MRGTSWLSPKKKRTGWQRNVKTITNLKRKDMEREELLIKKYAQEHRCDIIKRCTERNGFIYYVLDFSSRPRYTGHPHVVKISHKGMVIRVFDVEEIYWAYKHRAKEPEQFS